MMMRRCGRVSRRVERPRAVRQPLGGIGKERQVVALSVASSQWEARIARRHQIKHARVQVIVDEIVLAAEGEGGVAVHAFGRRRQRQLGSVARLWPVESSTRCHARVSAVTVTVAQQNGCDVDALRSRTTFDAELETFASGSLFGNVSGQSGREGEIATDLTHHQNGAQMLGVNLNMPSRFLVDDAHWHQLFERCWSRETSRDTSGRNWSSPLAAVDKRSRNRVNSSFVGAFRCAVWATLDDDGNLQK